MELGKFAQATASGIIIGWVYFRYGLASAILVHWSTNYFIFSYVYFLAEINEITVKNAFSHSLINRLEILFFMTGVFSIVLIIINYLNLKKEKNLRFRDTLSPLYLFLIVTSVTPAASATSRCVLFSPFVTHAT